MRILAIETSCDETALALVEATGGLAKPRFKVLQNLVSSQIEVHRPWGGVVPMLAKREHEKNLPHVFSKLRAANFSSLKCKSQNLKSNALVSSSRFLAPDLLAVTVGPGLEPALWAGIEFAKELKRTTFPRVPLVGVNHLEGHLYSFLLSQKAKSSKPQTLNLARLFPAVALIVSGGHTILLRVISLTRWEKLGETRDDAVGEAFDKTAKMLGLPYPGGPEIQRAAAEGDPAAIAFPRPMLATKGYDFSFSGLKTAVLYHLRDHHARRKPSECEVADIAASFQAAAVETLAAKTGRALTAFGAKSLLLSGGVAANAAVRTALAAVARERKIFFLVPPTRFNTDNATMIAAAAYLTRLQKKRYALKAQGNLNI
ncbi:MAG: tRNA (adenosine(37)-N6)-threonylcarbamoyltransferase complex transferase subunit TsaD [Patescibacteria group bacterium]